VGAALLPGWIRGSLGVGQAALEGGHGSALCRASPADTFVAVSSLPGSGFWRLPTALRGKLHHFFFALPGSDYLSLGTYVTPWSQFMQKPQLLSSLGFYLQRLSRLFVISVHAAHRPAVDMLCLWFMLSRGSPRPDLVSFLDLLRISPTYDLNTGAFWVL
jgi:hypothetical protein